MTPAPAILMDGDSEFLGVDQRTHPAALPPGIGSDARNKRFHERKAADRLGITIRPLGPYDPDTPGSSPWTPYYRPQGATVFRDPESTQWDIVVAAGQVWAFTMNQTGIRVPLPAGITLAEDEDTEYEFTQAFDKLLLWRGEDETPLLLESINDGFAEITQTSSGSGNGTGTLTIPNSNRASFIQNRVFACSGDNVYISDAQNLSRYSLLNAARINDGSDDRLLHVVPFGDTSAVAFKTKSVHLLGNLVADTSGNFSSATRTTITRQHGLVAPNAIAQVGRDLFYMSSDGLTSVQLTEENNVRGTDVPLSWPMKALWDRINWRAAHRSQLAYWDSKLYWAVPVDNSPVPNAIGVYDFRTRYWCGTDEGDALAFGVKRFLPQFFNGQLRLFFLDWLGLVRLYEEGFHDYRQADFRLNEDGVTRRLTEFGLPRLTEDLDIYAMSVKGSFTARGYTCGHPGRKSLGIVTPTVETWKPTWSLTGAVDGPSETRALISSQTRSRTRYTTYSSPAWNPTNANDDHAKRRREDYCVELGAGMVLGSGVRLDLHQTYEQPKWSGQQGRYFQPTFSNTTGRCDLRSLVIEATPTDSNPITRT